MSYEQQWGFLHLVYISFLPCFFLLGTNTLKWGVDYAVEQ